MWWVPRWVVVEDLPKIRKTIKTVSFHIIIAVAPRCYNGIQCCRPQQQHFCDPSIACALFQDYFIYGAKCYNRIDFWLMSTKAGHKIYQFPGTTCGS